MMRKHRIVILVTTLAAAAGACLAACGSSDDNAAGGGGPGTDSGLADGSSNDVAPRDAGPDTSISRGDAGPCTPDLSFGTGGTFFVPFPDAGPRVSPALMLSDSVVAIQHFGDVSNTAPEYVTRYTLDGKLDPTFNGGAPLALNFGTGSTEAFQGIFQQSDGKLVVYGYSFSGGDGAGLVARINTDGTLDTGFATGGKLVSIPPFEDPESPVARLFSGTQLADGTLLLAGSNSSGEGNWYLMRLTAAGAVDTTFGTAGFANQATATASPSGGISVQSTGQLVVAGSLSRDPTLWGVGRFSAQGTLDSTYGTAGLASVTVGDQGIGQSRIDTTNRLTAVGGGGENPDAGGAFFAAARFNGGGTLDSAFNSGSVLKVPLGSSGGSFTSVSSLLVDDQQRFVLTGSYGTGGQAVVVRLKSDGTVDDTCGTAGIALPPVAGVEYRSIAAAFDAQDRLVFAAQGLQGTMPGIYFARLWM